MAAWLEFVQGALLHLEVGLDVEVSGVRALVTEPKRDDLWGDAGLKQMHRGAVAQSVRGDGLAVDRRTSGSCVANQTAQVPRNSPAGERLAKPIGQERSVSRQMIGSNPLAQ